MKQYSDNVKLMSIKHPQIIKTSWFSSLLIKLGIKRAKLSKGAISDEFTKQYK